MGLQGSPPIFVPLFCSTDLFALELTECLSVPTNFYSAMTFLYLRLGPHHLMSECPHQFLFCCFCSIVFVSLFLFRSFCCSDLFALEVRVPPHQLMSESPHQFLFRCFCSPDHFALELNQCTRVPTNFYSTMTFLHLRLGPHHLMSECLHQLLFCCFCSAVFVLLTFLHLHFGFLRVATNFCSTYLFVLALGVLKGPHQFFFHCFCSADLFALGTYLMSESPHQFLFHYDLFALSPPLFVPLFLFRYFCSTDHFALTTVWGGAIT